MGSAGTGGGSSSRVVPRLARFGDGSLKVRSVIDPELFCLCRPGIELPLDETDPDLWALRFVGKSPTGVGVVGRERRAAAAAAFDKLALEARFARKA